MKKFLTLVIVMFFAFVLVGCEKQKLQGITVSGDGNLKVGETATYKVKFTPEDFKNQEVVWSTNDDKVLKVDSKTGSVEAIAEGTAFVIATSVADDQVSGRKKVSVANEVQDSEYPNLEGYTIKIAQAGHALQEYDPFHDDYTQADKDAKQEAWRSVEDDFNCSIEVVAYPSSAEWGPSRWAYILQQAQIGVSDYDFYTVPDSKIAEFAEGGALIDLTDAYVKYGKKMMDPSFEMSGSYKQKLYSFTASDNNIYAVMYYNIALLEALQEADSTLQEPAQIFLDGEWTHSRFVEYCEQVQAAMAKAYGELGTAGAATQTYFAVSGWDSYWWVGLATGDGVPLADNSAMKINLGTDNKVSAANAVKAVYERGFADPKQSVDGAVVSWNEGRALFNTGDLWFVGDEGRWKKNLWGDDTRYGYCPWPRADEVAFEDIKVAMGGTATWVMPIGRDYSEYGEECNHETIYYAMCEYFRRAEDLYKNAEGYDEDIALQNLAARYAHSEASQKAFLHVQGLIKDQKGYYDPLCVPDNSIGSLYSSHGNMLSIAGAVYAYVNGDVSTWAEAITSLVPELQEALRRAYN